MHYACVNYGLQTGRCQAPIRHKRGVEPDRKNVAMANNDLQVPTHSDGKPRLSVWSLGGTAAMVTPAAGSGATPTLGAGDLIDAVPGIRDFALVDAVSYYSVPGASLTIEQMIALTDDLRRACASGADGIVVVQGTDTMEETSYLAGLLWDLPQPLVFTGAMRPADAVGADGPANLLAATLVAASTDAWSRGSLVVMNEEIHLAETVRKRHTSSVGAFGSPDSGAVGALNERAVAFFSPPHRYEPLSIAAGVPVPRVALVRLALGDDTALVEAAAESYDGLIVEAFGGGHVPSWWTSSLASAAKRMPVVLASRTGGGSVLTSTYDFPGSERGLLESGLMSAGRLDGPKARILLTLVMMATSVHEDRSRMFARLSGRGPRRVNEDA